MKHPRLVIPLLMLGLAAPIAAATSTQAATTHPGPANLSHRVTATQADPTKYWTPARMAHAIPLGAPAKAAQALRGSGPSTHTLTAPTQGTPITVGEAKPTVPFRAPVTQASALRRPYDNKVERTNAAIFFTRGGYDWMCSGTVVNSGTRSMVSTAGHCVAEYGEWSANMVVVPGFSSACDGCGDAPYGVWSAENETTTNEWFYNDNLLQDYGFVIVHAKRHEIVDKVGGRGMKWNLGYDRNFVSFGYPAEAPFDGYNQESCKSPALWTDDPTYGTLPGPLTLAMACDMTPGSSGGSWNVVHKRVIWRHHHHRRIVRRKYFVNGLNSYKYLDDPYDMYGPYFGQEAYDLYTYTDSLG